MDKEKLFISCFDSRLIGDDGAVIGELIYSADAFCEGSHFRREWMSPAQIGRKAMLVNLSDAVAMNADPRYALLTVSIPREYAAEEIRSLAGSLYQTAQEYGCEIIGGDTVGADHLNLSVTLVSYSSAPLLRTGIREGDLLAFTGELGGCRRDLHALMRGERIPEDSRFYEPRLRRDFIRKSREFLRAGMDISDGLFCDCNKLLEANGLGADILININEETGLSGEEYEMLVAFSPENEAVVRSYAKETGTPLTIFAKTTLNDFRFPCTDHHFGREDEENIG